MLCLAGWAVLAVYFSDLSGRPPRTLLALLVAAAFVGALFIRKPKYAWAIAFVVPFLVVLAWFFSIHPSNDRDWQQDVAVLPYATIDGNHVMVHNIRNFHWTGENEATPAYYDKEFDLDKLRVVDFILSYWGSKAIAHTIVSFGFDGDQYLAMSIETRKEKGENYSAVQGFFRQYELTYVLADERDVLGVRTDHRNEEVYMFRTRINPAHARAMLLDYLKTANQLKEQPVFYNALTTNCTTSILPHVQVFAPTARLSAALLLNGYCAESIYDHGGFDHSMPFDELMRRGHINDAAKAAGESPDFSARIRQGVPTPPPRPSDG
jgi:hypothetical protein